MSGPEEIVKQECSALWGCVSANDETRWLNTYHSTNPTGLEIHKLPMSIYGDQYAIESKDKQLNGANSAIKLRQ